METPRLQRIMIHARELAQEHKVSYVGSEHVLYGIIAESGGMAKKILEEAGFKKTPQEIREIIKKKTDELAKKYK